MTAADALVVALFIVGTFVVANAIVFLVARVAHRIRARRHQRDIQQWLDRR